MSATYLALAHFPPHSHLHSHLQEITVTTDYTYNGDEEMIAMRWGA